MTSRSVVLPLLIGACMALMLLRGVLPAKWSVYADHEIMVYLGDDRVVHLSEIPSLLLATEVGYPGELTRYRPGYYLAWITEAWLWGDNPTLWQIARVVMLGVYLSVIVWWLSASFSLLAASLLTALLTLTTGFATVWIGIGPGEQYMSAFGAVYLFLLSLEWRDRHESTRLLHFIRWTGIAISGVFLIGCKENMGIMSLLPVVTTYRLFQRGTRPVWPLLVTALLLGYTAFITLAVASGVLHAQADFYGKSISVIDRVRASLGATITLPMIIPTVIMLSYALLACVKKSFRSFAPRSLIIKLCGLYLCMLAHVLFYNGWVNDSRYSFPGELLFFSFMLIFIRDLPGCLRFRPDWRSNRATLLICFFCGVAIYLQGYHGLHASAEVFTQRSIEYTNTLDLIAESARQTPAKPVVIESAHPYDFEAIFSVNRFLKSLGVTNPIFLHQSTAEGGPGLDPFALSLRGVLEEMSVSGREPAPGAAGTLPSRYAARFSPISELNRSAGCIAVFLQRAPDDKSCEISYRVTY